MCVSRRKPGTRAIPVIDLGLLKTDRAAFVQAVGAALEDIGFFALEGHGVSSAAIDGAYAEGQAFFARPLGEKLAFDATGNGGQRGYTPMCQEHAKDATQPDLKVRRSFSSSAAPPTPRPPRGVLPRRTLTPAQTR